MIDARGGVEALYLAAPAALQQVDSKLAEHRYQCDHAYADLQVALYQR